VDLGNGLFLDAHNNLSVNILKLLGIDRKKDDFKIVKNGITYEKTGNIFKEKYRNSTNKEITLKDTGATLDVGGLIKANKHKIIVFNNEIIFEPGGVIKALWRTKINKTSDGAVISNVTQERKITLNANGNIHLSEGLVIKSSGKSLFFDLSGRFGADKIYLKHRTYFLKQSKNTLVYYAEKLNGITIDISENAVTVKKGPQIEVYEISYQN
jgi:hypothetical protein